MRPSRDLHAVRIDAARANGRDAHLSQRIVGNRADHRSRMAEARQGPITTLASAPPTCRSRLVRLDQQLSPRRGQADQQFAEGYNRGRHVASDRLARQPAAVDGQDMAVDIVRRRARRGTPPRRRDPSGSPQRPAGMRSRIWRLRVLVGLQRRGVVGRDIARRDGVDVDALGRPFVGQQLSQAADARSWMRYSWARGCRPGRSASRRC